MFVDGRGKQRQQYKTDRKKKFLKLKLNVVTLLTYFLDGVGWLEEFLFFIFSATQAPSVGMHVHQHIVHTYDVCM